MVVVLVGLRGEKKENVVAVESYAESNSGNVDCEVKDIVFNATHIYTIQPTTLQRSLPLPSHTYTHVLPTPPCTHTPTTHVTSPFCTPHTIPFHKSDLTSPVTESEKGELME